MKLGRTGAPCLQVPNIPFSVGTASEPMDSLRGLHDAKLTGAMTAEIVLNESCDPEIDGYEPPSGDFRRSYARKGDSRAFLRRFAPQPRRWLHVPRASHKVLQLPIGPPIARVLSLLLDPAFRTLQVRQQFGSRVGWMPVGAVPRFVLDVVPTVVARKAGPFRHLNFPATSEHRTSSLFGDLQRKRRIAATPPA